LEAVEAVGATADTEDMEEDSMEGSVAQGTNPGPRANNQK
jgi:hypothetical protein